MKQRQAKSGISPAISGGISIGAQGIKSIDDTSHLQYDFDVHKEEVGREGHLEL